MQKATEASFDVKGKILAFAWLLKKQGYSEETIRLHVSALRKLMKEELIHTIQNRLRKLWRDKNGLNREAAM